MDRSVIATLTVLATLGFILPAQAQRFGNSSTEFYDQGLYRLEQEVQRLQKLETTSQPSPLKVQPPNSIQDATQPVQPDSQTSPSPSHTSPQQPSLPTDSFPSQEGKGAS